MKGWRRVNKQKPTISLYFKLAFLHHRHRKFNRDGFFSNLRFFHFARIRAVPVMGEKNKRVEGNSKL